jgi:hypothetical protein
MAKKSLTNFCVVVLSDCQFWRSQFPFEKSIQQRLSGAAEGYLSYFRAITGSKEAPSLSKGIHDEALWAILVHEACAGYEPVAGQFRTGGWPMEFSFGLKS